MSLQEAGPETTHTEHWQRRTDGLESVTCAWMASVTAITERPQLLLDRFDDGLTVASPEISGVTATAQFS